MPELWFQVQTAISNILRAAPLRELGDLAYFSTQILGGRHRKLSFSEMERTNYTNFESRPTYIPR